jgi:hypothetical protein
MAEIQTTAWRDGRLVDDQPVPARPWSFLVALAAIALLADLALGWVGFDRGLAAEAEPREAAGVRAVLEAAAHDREPYLLIGDSVLAGDVMRGKVDDWEEHRVIDAMRDAVNPDSDATFHQVALDALLPVDILHIVAELDAVDPTGRVPVVIELNPRFFSRSYAEAGGCTRPWLCTLGPTLVDRTRGIRWNSLTKWLGRLALDGIAQHVPLARHRAWLHGEGLDEAVASLVPRREQEVVDELTARARVLEHNRGLVLGTQSKQVQALQSTIGRLRATGRRALFFTTPLNDAFLDEAMEPHVYGRYQGRMSGLIDRMDNPELEVVHLDHPLFGDELFLDHCHMGAEGNRRLAVNLLAELGVGLAQVPDEDELVELDMADRTLVGRAEQGHRDGAAWHAMTFEARGVAVAPGGRRVVIADTGNHVLREMTGELRTLRTIAGAPGFAGDRDGLRGEALLERPAFPVLIGKTVYFSDQAGKRLKSFVDGKVTTIAIAEGVGFKKIRGLAGEGTRLLLQDGRRRILEIDPVAKTSRVVAEATEGSKIEVFAAAPDGRLFVADGDSRIWVGERTGEVLWLGLPDGGFEVEVGANAASVIPQTKGLYFPLRYAQMRFANIVGMTWVDRYGGLLVQDDIPQARQVPGMTERIQLRFVDPKTKLIYPWLKPLVHGGGYMYYNKRSKSIASYFHEGTMAIDQATATVFWLERHRSRLFSFADGMLGVAKIGHIRDLEVHGFRDMLGPFTATRAFASFQPHQYLDRRLGRHDRAGPYQGVIIGSSMLSKVDSIGSYSFGVRLERRLREALGWRDGIDFELYQRSYGGVPSEKVLQELWGMQRAGAQLDVIFVELCGSRKRFFETGATDERMREILGELDAIARRYDTQVIFFDDSALVSGPRDGNRGTPPDEARFEAMARAAGFPVIDLGPELMRDALDLSPFGSPPIKSHHAGPWAIDEAADMLGDRAYPMIRDHLRGRVPALLRAPPVDTEDSAAIADVFDEVPADWEALLPTVTDVSAQSTLVGDELKIFVDLGRLQVDTADTDALDDIATAALHMFIVTDPAGARARRVDVKLARFSRYDEYGAGVRDAAEVVRAHALDRAGIVALLQATRARLKK